MHLPEHYLIEIYSRTPVNTKLVLQRLNLIVDHFGYDLNETPEDLQICKYIEIYNHEPINFISEIYDEVELLQIIKFEDWA